MGIGVIFEKENINTLEENSEVVLTILASLAQEELNSLSQNIKMGKRMAMQEGKVSFRYESLYAYRKGEDEQLEIIPEEAEIVKRIYTAYLAGESVTKIMQTLNEEKIPSPQRKNGWIDASIRRILENERYCGDVILQKTYISDPITKKVIVNNGQLPKVYTKNNHTPIVSREVYEQAQQERTRRSCKRKTSKHGITELGKYSGKYALSEILVCGECMTPYRRRVWTKRSGEKIPVWRCISRLEYATQYCKDSPTVDEEALHDAITQAINDTRIARRDAIPFLSAHLERTMQEQRNERINVQEVEHRIAVLKEQTMELMEESTRNSTVGENSSRLRAMSDEVKSLSEMLIEYRQSCNASGSIESQVARITGVLENEPEHCDTYNDSLVRQLIDTIKVMDEGRLEIIFKGGFRYEQAITLKVRKLHAAS